MTIAAGPAEEQLDRIVALARKERRSLLFEPETYAFLPMLGLRPPRHTLLPPRPEHEAFDRAARLLPGRRIVAKIVATGVVHKSDAGGVAFLEKDARTIRETHAAMLHRFRGHDVRGILLTELVEHDGSPAAELLLGIRATADFGPVVSLGFGGVLTETLTANLPRGREIAIFSPGLTDPASVDAILRGKLFTSLVTGAARGQRERISLSGLADLVRHALAFAAAHVPDTLAEIEINPFTPTPAGPVALDAVARLGAPGDPTPPPRPLARLDRLLRPRSIAIAGVSRAANAGRVMLANLIAAGFDRSAITVIKPGEAEIDGCRCVPDLESLSSPVDLLVLALAAAAVPEMVERTTAGRLAESIVVIPGGLGEREGSEGLEGRVRHAIESARETAWGGPILLGPNSLGFRSAPGGVDTIFLPRHKVEGGTGRAAEQSPPARSRAGSQAAAGAAWALISQSGAFAATREMRLAAVAPPRYLLSIGNQLDLTAGDWMRRFAHERGLDVLAFYLEGFRPLDGRAWAAAAADAKAHGKSVLLYRAGRTHAGREATASHTAVVAGDEAVARELARAAGALVAETIDEFEDLARLLVLLHDRTPRGRRLGAVSNAGFETVAFADHAGELDLVPFSETTAAEIARIVRASHLEGIVTATNPLDVNPMMGDEAFAAAAAAVLADEGVDLAIVGCVPLTPALQTLPRGTHCEDLADGSSVASRLSSLWRASSKPWVAVVDGGTLYDPMAARLERAGIPLFRTADRAARALATWTAWRMAR